MIRLRVKEIAKEKGMSMHKLSRTSDVSLTLLKLIYDDPYHNVTAATLEKIARALGVSFHDLAVEEEGTP